MERRSVSALSVPALLLVLSAIPLTIATVRLYQIPSGTLPQDALYYIAMPVAHFGHVLAGALFCVLGPFQFGRVIAGRRGLLHRLAGRVFVAAGAVLVLSGLRLLWMLHGGSTPLIDITRLASGLGLGTALWIAVCAAIGREAGRHRDWMIRAYAIGVGTTASGIVLFPIYLLTGVPPTGLGSDLIFVASWIGSIAAGEWVIRRLWRGRAAPLRRAPPLLIAHCVLALGMLIQPGEAHAEGLRYSIGVLAGAGQSPFEKDHTDSAVFPDFSIEGDRFSLGYSGLTFDVVERGGLTIAARLAPRLFAADPSDVTGLERLERDIAIEAGLSARFAFGTSEAEFEVLHDISDTHGGTAVNASLSTGYSVSDRFQIGASAAATWMDADLATYSYGVFASEADGSLAAYRVGASVIPSVGLHASYAITDHVSVLGGLETTFLPEQVTDSPIVKRDTLTSISVGMRYDF